MSVNTSASWSTWVLKTRRRTLSEQLLSALKKFHFRNADPTSAVVTIDADAPEANRADNVVPSTFCSKKAYNAL